MIEGEFVQLLRRLFKGDSSNVVFAGVYMTGILPIKKYKTESALNNFKEYSVVSPKRLDKFFGFTKAETQELAKKKEEAVAKALEHVHDDETSILSYNDEESLSCAISIAYYYAKNDYIIHRELASGKGFADLVFRPRKNVHKPAMIVELKYDKDADTAISQIKQKNYPAKVAEYIASHSTGDGQGEALLLVGINYDKKTKTHTCVIEKYAE